MRRLFPFVLVLVSCHNLEPAITAANVQHDIGHEMAKLIYKHCEEPYASAPSLEAIQDLNDLGCPEAAHAHEAFKEAHDLVVATTKAIYAGRCTSVVSQAPRECNLTKALADLAAASADLAVAVQPLLEKEE